MSLKAMAWAIEQSCGGPSTKVTLWSIANYVNKETWCGYVAQKTLAEETEQSPDSVQRRIPELIERGLLVRIPLRCGGRRSIDFFVLRPSAYFGRPLAEIEPLLPREHSIDPSFIEEYAAAAISLPQSAATPLPQTLPQSVAAPVRQLVSDSSPVSPEERERGREGGKKAAVDVGRAALAAALEGLRKAWPDFALENQEMVLLALGRLSAAERESGIAAVPAFVAYHLERRKKAPLPYLHVYLGQKRWVDLPAAAIKAPAAASGGGEYVFVGAFDRAWCWLYFDAVKRFGPALRDARSSESAWLREKVAKARIRIGWRVASARIAEIEAAARSFVQIAVDGAEFKAWAAALKLVGVDLPRPDAAPFVYAPSQWPPDDREREARLRDEMAEMNE